MKNQFLIIETTCPNLDEAQILATNILNQKLSPCIHFTPINSAYMWQNSIQKSEETLLRIKSKTSLYPQIEKIIKETHSYENPEIITFEIKNGSQEYLDWLDSVSH